MFYTNNVLLSWQCLRVCVPLGPFPPSVQAVNLDDVGVCYTDAFYLGLDILYINLYIYIYIYLRAIFTHIHKCVCMGIYVYMYYYTSR